MNNVYDQFDPAAATAVNPYDQFDAVQPTPQKSFIDRLFDLAKTPSPQWLQGPERATRKFLTTPLVPADVAEQALRATPVGATLTQAESLFPQAVPVQMASGALRGGAQAASGFSTPENLALLGLIPGGPVGKVIAAGFTVDALRQYPDLWRRYWATDDARERGAILAQGAALALPAAGLFGRGSGDKTLLGPRSTSDSLRLDTPTAPVIPINPKGPKVTESTSESLFSQPNVPDDYARFQPPVSESATSITETLPAAVQKPPSGLQEVLLPSEQAPSQPEPTQTVAGTQVELTPQQTEAILQTLPEQSVTKLRDDGYADDEIAQILAPEQTQQIGEQNAGEITSTAGLPSGEVRPSVAQETPLRQPGGETASARQEIGQEQVQQEGTIAQPPLPETPRTTGIAARVHEQRGLGIEPGQGISAKVAVEQGRAAVGEADTVAARIKATGQVSAGDLGILRAKQEQFAKVTNAAEDALRVKPNDPALGQQYEQAFQQERDYAQNVVKPAQTIWHKLGMEQQGAVDIDTGSFTGLRRMANDELGRDIKPNEAPKLEAAAERVRQFARAEVQARQRLSTEMSKVKTRLPIEREALSKHFAEKFKKMLPC